MKFRVPNFLVGYSLGASTVGVIESIYYRNIYFVIGYMIMLIIMVFACVVRENKKVIDTIKVEPMVFYPAACSDKEFRDAMDRSRRSPEEYQLIAQSHVDRIRAAKF